jgi:DDE superfamily endonuclease/Transposase DDE domain
LGFIVHETAGGAATDLTRLAVFRQRLYACFASRADALFELTDALAGADRPVRSVAELMYEPVSRRGWGSLYQALEHGRVDLGAARDLLARQVQQPRAGGPVMFAVDVSKYPRPDTRYTADVGMQYAAERDRHGGSPAVPGWAMQWVAQVGVTPRGQPGASWSVPVDVRRVGTGDNANEVAAGQLAEVADRVRQTFPDAVPLFLLDVGYCPIYLTQQLPIYTQILVRLRGDRVFFAPPPPRIPGQVGRPRKHGPRFALDEPDTWGPPDAEHTDTRADGSRVWTRAWHHKHPEPRPRRKWAGTGIVEGTLIRREKTFPDGRTQLWWLWWAGPPDAFNLEFLAGAYRHRFTIEHTFRYLKQDLCWTRHTPIDPDQALRWSWLVAFAYTQLLLARPLAADHRLPWERPCPPDRLSPRRVRRGFRLVTADLPTQARSPKPSRPGPGRPKGSKNKNLRTRQPVIKKGRPANTGHPKGRNPKAKTTQTP